jgi:hypothetical protein
MFSGFPMYFLLVISLFSDRSSVPVVILIVFAVCAVTIGVVSFFGFVCFVLRFVVCVMISVVC